MKTKAELMRALNLLLDGVVESVAVAGDQGAPGGVLYAAFMAHGCTLAQFEYVMEALVQSGRLRRSGHLYFAAKAVHS
jgi:hypothetical protein